MQEIEKVKIPEESEGGDFQTQQSYEDRSREHRSYEKSTLRKFQGVLLQTGGKVSLRNEIIEYYLPRNEIISLTRRSRKFLQTIPDALT